jgi:Fe-S-cluster-containing dehydrogenase component
VYAAALFIDKDIEIGITLADDDACIGFNFFRWVCSYLTLSCMFMMVIKSMQLCMYRLSERSLEGHAGCGVFVQCGVATRLQSSHIVSQERR